MTERIKDPRVDQNVGEDTLQGLEKKQGASFSSTLTLILMGSMLNLVWEIGTTHITIL